MRKKESILTGSQSSIFALSEQVMAHNALLAAISSGAKKGPLSNGPVLYESLHYPILRRKEEEMGRETDVRWLGLRYAGSRFRTG
jgi:hypothetical protein